MTDHRREFSHLGCADAFALGDSFASPSSHAGYERIMNAIFRTRRICRLRGARNPPRCSHRRDRVWFSKCSTMIARNRSIEPIIVTWVLHERYVLLLFSLDTEEIKLFRNIDVELDRGDLMQAVDSVLSQNRSLVRRTPLHRFPTALRPGSALREPRQCFCGWPSYFKRRQDIFACCAGSW